MNSNRTGSQVHFLAVAVFLAMVGTGYAVSTSSVVADPDSGIAIPTVPAAAQAQNYFPAQYVNQATVTEEHIQAF